MWRTSWLIVPAFLFLAGVLLRADEGQPDKGPLLTDKDNKTKVKLTKAEVLTVRLEYTAGTGYTWVPAKVPEQLQAVAKTVIDTPKGLPGGSGTQTMRFLPTKPGTGTLTLEYKRPFEKDKPAAKTFTVQVQVE